MSKQTATDYLIQEIKNDSLVQAKSTKEWNEVFRIAKLMEHEQIIDAYVECYMNHVGNGESILREANSYYKNTYGGQNESNFN
jgi:hypothetical protein